jgi:hypothetical protein
LVLVLIPLAACGQSAKFGTETFIFPDGYVGPWHIDMVGFGDPNESFPDTILAGDAKFVFDSHGSCRVSASQFRKLSQLSKSVYRYKSGRIIPEVIGTTSPWAKVGELIVRGPSIHSLYTTPSKSGKSRCILQARGVIEKLK